MHKSLGLHHTLRRGADLSDKLDRTALFSCDGRHRWVCRLGGIIALDGLSSEHDEKDKIDSA